jgi:hypothetical protein
VEDLESFVRLDSGLAVDGGFDKALGDRTNLKAAAVSWRMGSYCF